MNCVGVDPPALIHLLEQASAAPAARTPSFDFRYGETRASLGSRLTDWSLHHWLRNRYVRCRDHLLWNGGVGRNRYRRIRRSDRRADFPRRAIETLNKLRLLRRRGLRCRRWCEGDGRADSLLGGDIGGRSRTHICPRSSMRDVQRTHDDHADQTEDRDRFPRWAHRLPPFSPLSSKPR